MITITYKTILAEFKPYPSTDKNNYLSFLKSNQEKIYSGEIGIYLSRRINLDSQNLYFPFIDIDGNGKLEGDQKIESAILNTSLSYDIFKKLGVEKYFSIIATGNTGFRMVSNILLDIDTYRAFLDFIKKEMPNISDLQPSEDLEMPHQLFVYKGNAEQNKKELVDGHSTVISDQVFESGIMTPDYYKEITAGKPDPEMTIRFMEQFLNFRQISDLNALDEFGKKLIEYRNIHRDIKINTFKLSRFRKKGQEPISLKVMEEKLTAQNILCKIENRGNNLAISFKGIPCPLCKETEVNSVAYPSSYKLLCFNSDCRAYYRNGGVPLTEWMVTNPANKEITTVITQREDKLGIKAPEKFESIEEAQKKIESVLSNNENTLILVTAGVGNYRKFLFMERNKNTCLF